MIQGSTGTGYEDYCLFVYDLVYYLFMGYFKIPPNNSNYRVSMVEHNEL
jgi:hypothetical protein